MSTHRDPPRLREMGADLPYGLAAALEADPSEFPQAIEMSDLAERLGPLLKTATVAAATAIPVSLMAPKAPLSLVATLKWVALKWGHTVILPMAIGAASGAVAWEARDYVASKESSPPAITKVVPLEKAKSSVRGAASRRESIEPQQDDRTYDEPGVASADPIAAPARAPSPLGPSRVTAPSPPAALEVPPVLAATENITEFELIDRAQRALAQQPAVARRWLEEHTRRFPDGTYAQEREAIAIEALVGEGRLVEAHGRAAQFRTNFPQSAYLRRIDAVLRNPKGRPSN